jgi:hypothetical protein
MHGKGFSRKAFSEGAQYAGRDYWLSQLKRVLSDEPVWRKEGEWMLQPNGKRLRIHMFGKYGWKSSQGGWENRLDCPIPVIGIKTGQGLRNQSGIVKGEMPVDELPYWGNAHDLRIKVFGNCQEVCNCTKVEV